jgi:hypothetical protein
MQQAERASLLQELAQHTGFGAPAIALIVRNQALQALASACGAPLEGPRYCGEELAPRAFRCRLRALRRAGMRVCAVAEPRLGKHLVCAVAAADTLQWAARLHTPIGFSNFLEHGVDDDGAQPEGMRCAYGTRDAVLRCRGQRRSVPLGSARLTARSHSLAASLTEQRTLSAVSPASWCAMMAF